MEAKQIIYATLIMGVMTTLLVAFMYNMQTEYDVTIPANNTMEQEVFDLMTSNINESYQLSQDMSSKVQSSEGVSLVDWGVIVSKSVVQAVKLLFTPITMYITLFSTLSVIFGLPAWVFPTLITFIIVAIMFVIIKAIMRYDV